MACMYCMARVMKMPGRKIKEWGEGIPTCQGGEAETKDYIRETDRRRIKREEIRVGDEGRAGTPGKGKKRKVFRNASKAHKA